MADIKLPGMTFAMFVRSPHAHARLLGIDATAPLAMEGVVAVLTGADMKADNVGGIPCGWCITGKHGLPMKEPPHPAMAYDTVRHVGDPVALVIAKNVDLARLAAESVVVTYDILPAVVGVPEALRPGALAVFDDIPDNLCWEIGDRAATDRAFADAAHVSRVSLSDPLGQDPRHHRQVWRTEASITSNEVNILEVAEGMGFEPTVGIYSLQRFSKPSPSAARPPLRTRPPTRRLPHRF